MAASSRKLSSGLAEQVCQANQGPPGQFQPQLVLYPVSGGRLLQNLSKRCDSSWARSALPIEIARPSPYLGKLYESTLAFHWF